MSCFSKLTQQQEETASWWQTTKIANCPQDIARLANAAAVIQTHFISPETWETRVNEGSVTFQNAKDRRQVISVFIDHNGSLAKECGLQLRDNPIAVGIEITYMPPYIRQLIRHDLRTRFSLYMDPEDQKQSHKKYYLSPNPDHCFDVLFLSEGQCELTADPQAVNNIQEAIERKIEERGELND